jgi:hypothetical protein
MRTMKTFAVVLLFSSFFFGCKKAQEAVNAYVNSLSATVNGSAFTSTNTNAARNPSNGATQVTIDATASNGQRVAIAINNYTGATGTFPVGSGSICGFNAGTASDVIATNGVVAITNIDNSKYTNGPVVSGAFSFTAGAYTVTNGTFSVFVAN